MTVVADSVLIEENSAIDVQALHPQERERKTGGRESSDPRGEAILGEVFKPGDHLADRIAA